MRFRMNFAAMRFDWNQARAFLATAETGSFSAAARALGQTQPTLGRQVAALEDHLDIVLFERIGRKLVLTPAGLDLLDHMRAMGEAATRVSLIASGRSEAIAGEVCISTTDIFAVHVMPRILAGLREIAPQIRVRIVAENTLSDLQRREADIAIRNVRPTQPDLVSRKVREAGGRLFAAQAYLDRLGPVRSPEDLRNADFIGWGDNAEMLRFLHAWGLPVTDANFVTSSQSGIVNWHLALGGLGIMPMSDDLAPLFANMQPVLPDLPPVPVPYWLTAHRELHSSRRIRLVFDHLAATLARPDLPG